MKNLDSFLQFAFETLCHFFERPLDAPDDRLEAVLADEMVAGEHFNVVDFLSDRGACLSEFVSVGIASFPGFLATLIAMASATAPSIRPCDFCLDSLRFPAGSGCTVAFNMHIVSTG
jgi:hypothetical protein